jgi:aspartyl protease family protein
VTSSDQSTDQSADPFADLRLTEWTSCGGCAAKWGASLLTSLVLGWRGSFSEAIRSALIWFAAFVAIILAYSFRNELTPLADRVSGELNPAAPVSRTAGEVVLRRANDGHFYADMSINGTDMRLMADTGASVVVLSVEDAENAGDDKHP